MPIAKTHNIDHAYELLLSGKHKGIELEFDIDTNDFFKIVTEFGSKGAKITRINERFISKLKSQDIPAIG